MKDVLVLVGVGKHVVLADLRRENAEAAARIFADASSMKAKGIAELGICGVAAAVANAIYNATGVRVRDYQITLDKLLDRLPEAG